MHAAASTACCGLLSAQAAYSLLNCAAGRFTIAAFDPPREPQFFTPRMPWRFGATNASRRCETWNALSPSGTLLSLSAGGRYRSTRRRPPEIEHEDRRSIGRSWLRPLRPLLGILAPIRAARRPDRLRQDDRKLRTQCPGGNPGVLGIRQRSVRRHNASEQRRILRLPRSAHDAPWRCSIPRGAS